MKKLITSALAFVFFVSTIFAGGFQINEHGARAMGMAGAFTGLANDPSAIYYNGAGLTQLKGTHFYFGSTAIIPSSSFIKYTGANTTEHKMKSQLFTPINFYITQQITNKLSVGLGVNNQYGLGTKWEDNWIGKYIATTTEVRTFFISPVIAYELFNGLSISVGASYVLGDVTLERKINASPKLLPDAAFKMSGDGNAIGFNAGILYKVSNEFQIGASYRSSVNLEFSGTAASDPATFIAGIHPVTKQPIVLNYPNGDITAPLKTPQNITVGLAYKPSDNFTFTADYQYIGWSSYDKLEVTFASYDLDLNPANGTQNVSTSVRNYENTAIYRVGFEYKSSEKLAVRGGFLLDKNPVKTDYVDPTLPDADRIGINLGVGTKITDKLGIDLSYLYLIFSERTLTKSTINFNGTYKSNAHLIGLNLSYSL